MPLCLSFAGVAGCFPFHLGAAEVLQQLLPNDQEVIYAGVSSGSVVAMLLALGYSPAECEAMFTGFTRRFDRWYKSAVSHWFQYSRITFEQALRPDAYLRASNRLFIGYTALTSRGRAARVVSTFTSNQDLLDAVETSCHLPPFVHTPLRWYRGEWCFDGALINNFVKPEGYHTVGITTQMVQSQCHLRDWLPAPDMDKYGRLVAIGRNFVWRRRREYLQWVRGEKVKISLPPRGPIRWWLWWLLLLMWWKRR